MAQTNNNYDSLFDYYGSLYNVDPRLGKTVFHLESSGNPSTKDSDQGAEGGMQMLPSTAASLGVTNPRDMKQAIPAAMQYLSQGLAQTGTPAGALAYYHGGPNTAQWGPKTAAYVAKGQSLYPGMQITSPANDTTAPTPDTEFNQRWGLAPKSVPPSVASPSAAPPDDFAKRWGLEEPATAPVAGTLPTMTVTPGATPAPTLAANANAPPAAPAMGDPNVALNAAGGDQFIPNQQQPNQISSSYQGVRNLLAPAPNTTYGNILPYAVNDATGAARLAMPSAWRNLLQGGADLGFGPALGTVTPQATAALTNLVPGLMASPAAGTGGAIADLAAQRSVAPLSAEFRANPGITTPQLLPPGETTTINPLKGDIGNTNPLNAAMATPSATVPGSVAAQEAAETAAIPERVPPAPLIPPLSEKSAGTRADQLLQHFAAGKPVAENPDVVPGYLPKLAGLTNDPGVATLERGVQAVNPGPIGVRDQANQQAINTFTSKLVGAPEDVAAMQAQREAATGPLREAAFANASDVDPTPIVSQIDKILASPEGKRAAVQRTLANVRSSLFNENGELETDPEMLYGVRKNLNDLLDPVAQKDNPQLQQAARQLLDVKGGLDNVIEKGAPGFKDYVAQYADLSKPIDAQRYLQSLNLTNAADNVRLQSVDTAIKSIQRQQNMPGVQKASAVSPEQLDALQTLRNTLRMDQFSATAGKHLGANTFQNLATNSMAGRITGNPLVNIGMAGIGGMGGGIPGAMLATGANMAAHAGLDRAESLVRDAIIKRLLNHQGVGAAALKTASP